MATSTILSTKGQVIVPKRIRDNRKWTSGMRLIVEETPDGVLLRPETQRKTVSPDEAFHFLDGKISGPPATLEQMDASVLREARRRYAGD